MTAADPVTSPALRVVPSSEPVDLVGAERAATAFLNALGVDTDSGATAATPRRRSRSG